MTSIAAISSYSGLDMTKRRISIALASMATVLMLSGCGSSNYSQTLNPLIPAGWTKISETGKISSSCTGGAACGDVERTYAMNSTAQAGAAAMLVALRQHQCTATQEGNGLSADCTSGIHLAVSFTSTQASISLTKNQ